MHGHCCICNFIILLECQIRVATLIFRATLRNNSCWITGCIYIYIYIYTHIALAPVHGRAARVGSVLAAADAGLAGGVILINILVVVIVLVIIVVILIIILIVFIILIM